MALGTEIRQDKPKRCGLFFRLGFPNALLSFAHCFAGLIFTDLIMYRSHAVAPEFNGTESFALNTTYSSPEYLVWKAGIERYASVVLMTKSLIESILPTMISIFIGPWSEQGGRRPLLLAGSTGYVIMYGLLSFMCNWDIEPWYLVLPSITAQIMGGTCALTMASNCYISDTTTEKDRTVFLAWLQMSTFAGVVLGLVGGPLIFKSYGYTTVFIVALICCAYALLHMYFFVPESIKDTSKASLHTLFQISFLKESVTTCMFKRDGLHRPIVWLAIFVFTANVMMSTGDIGQVFLFARARLLWDVQEFSYWSSAGMVIGVGGLCGISLSNPVLGIPDTWLAVIGLSSSLGSSIAKALTWQGWHLYLASGIGVFGGIATPVTRSIVTKYVPAQDIGKVFSLMALMETLCPLVGAPLFTLVYTSYLPPIYPCPLYLLMAGGYASLVLCTVCIGVLIRKSRNMPYIPAAQEDKL